MKSICSMLHRGAEAQGSKPRTRHVRLVRKASTKLDDSGAWSFVQLTNGDSEVRLFWSVSDWCHLVSSTNFETFHFYPPNALKRQVLPKVAFVYPIGKPVMGKSHVRPRCICVVPT